ncbi:hypothetical protein LTR09_008524 [Extremus antarcticus]|uniref:Dolichol-phosphate mannosyltransferase subunit 3 n=1 Tax=Extremus antarcticus TaxID=702011 RepID=A0AAJ0DH96_9PEZI|nr:hypothetical protein LTR09_008524 [Extremus antarcticus]
MTRAEKTLQLSAIVSTLYMIFFVGILPIPEKITNDIIPYLPFWALVSFGAFLLGKLGYGVLTFNNVPDAYDELMGQIKEAKADLRKKGVEVGA